MKASLPFTYPHDVDLGPPLSPEDLGHLIHDNRHNPGLRAVLQLVRNSAAQNGGAAHDMVAAGHVDCGHLNLGAQNALLEVFWSVVASIQDPPEGEGSGESQ